MENLPLRHLSVEALCRRLEPIKDLIDTVEHDRGTMETEGWAEEQKSVIDEAIARLREFAEPRIFPSLARPW